MNNLEFMGYLAEQKVKHLIELVNEKYPNGWYCEALEEVKEEPYIQVGRGKRCYQQPLNSSWQDIECLSYADVLKIAENFNGMLDPASSSTYVQDKLKK
jgi:hypothetical protein